MKSTPNKLTIVLLLLLLTVACKANSQQNGTSFLWEVKLKADTTKVAYLLGSIHLAPPELYPLNPVIMAAWNKATALAVEINLQDTIHQQALFSDLSFVSKIINITEPMLSTKLPAPIYRRVQKQLAGGMFDSTMIDHLTPLGVAIMLELNGLTAGIDSIKSSLSTGIDLHFIELATNENKPIYELETLAGQLAVFETLNDNIVPYIETLLDKLEQPANSQSEQDLFKAWTAGDVEFMADNISAPVAADPAIDLAIKDAVLYKRNATMAAKIENYLTQPDTYFVVIGAGHYVGQRSIIELLQQSNRYIIRRL